MFTALIATSAFGAWFIGMIGGAGLTQAYHTSPEMQAKSEFEVMVEDHYAYLPPEHQKQRMLALQDAYTYGKAVSYPAYQAIQSEVWDEEN